MKVLIIGQGGREHALAVALKASKRPIKLYCAPGNAGMGQIGECVAIAADDVAGLLKFSQKEGIELVVVGPELALVKGIVDTFRKANIKIFGPDKFAAQLEGSKIFAKELMRKLSIPTADFKVFDKATAAKDYLALSKMPIVIKADGLAAGKGVTVAKTKEAAIEAVENIMVSKAFGEAGEKVLVEECLDGVEASLIAVSDGETIVRMAASQDHKRVFDRDEGPNTGGMGAYSPTPFVNKALEAEAEQRIFKPLIKEFKAQGHPLVGFIYAGVMLTAQGMQVLEFNVRFGDPEAQAILPRLKSDFLELMLAACEQRLANYQLAWKPEACVSVVLASGGYPAAFKKGHAIKGLDQAMPEGVYVYHAGTKQEGRNIVTAGGRVLNVSALGHDIIEAQANVYNALKSIHFKDVHYRKDIAQKAIQANVESK